MAQYKNKWESSSTRWWVRCTKETAAMMEQLDQTSDAPEKSREVEGSRGKSLSIGDVTYSR